MKDLPFPGKVTSWAYPDGQATIASISLNVRIMHEFQERWIGPFIHTEL